MNRSIRGALALLFLLVISPAQAALLSDEEEDFARLVNEYRVENGLDSIEVTVTLTQVAQIHALDLFTYEPHLAPGCNLHSWSANGAWTPVCYTSDHAQAANMWNKPNEISGGIYTGNGYEIAAYGYGSPEDALNGFKGSSAHNDVLLNQGIWAGYDPWAAMGVGIVGDYYLVWFGDAVDPQGDVYSVVPVPAGVWLFGSALLGLGVVKRKRR